jgi:hypothetical protein
VIAAVGFMMSRNATGLQDQPFTATIVNVQLVDPIRATKREKANEVL